MAMHGVYREVVPPERIVLTASSSESYSLLFKLVCDPGDAVLVPRPSYPLVEHLTALEALPRDGFTFTAVPPKIAGMGTFTVRAHASLEG